jgi:hypothetical protein
MAGEVTPTYFGLSRVRDPVMRAWSWYRVLHRAGRIRADFEDEILNGAEPQLREVNRYAFHLRAWRERFGTANVGVFFYDDLVMDPQRFADSLLGFLGLPRVMITPEVAVHLRHNEVKVDCRNPALAYRAFRFRIWLKSMRADSAVEKLERLGLWRFCFGGGQPFAPLAPQVEARLRKFFIPEVEALEEMLNRDLSDWKLPSPERAPMASAGEPVREIGSDKREHALLVVRVKKC